MKYRYIITNEGTVEADTTAEAEAAAFEALDLGAGIYICTIEPLPTSNGGSHERRRKSHEQHRPSHNA